MVWLKRLATPKWWPIEKKTKKFVAVPRGPYSTSLPLVVIIRDAFKICDSGLEARKIIKSGKVLVDGVKRKDPRFGLGSMCTIEIPDMQKSWRVVPRNGLSFVEIPAEESKLKICKILDKKTLRGGKTQINLDGGRNMLTKENYTTGDSLLLEMPEQKVVDVLKLEKKALAIVTRGQNSGKLAHIDSIDKKNRRAWLGSGESIFEVPLDAIVIVGKEKPTVKLE